MQWYPKYYGDYMKDTSDLSLAEHGAYNILLDHCYATEEQLVDDEMAWFRICGAITNEEQEAVRRVVKRFFPIKKNGKCHNKRIASELAKQQEVSSKRREAGRAGAEARWDKTENKGENEGFLNDESGNDMANAMASAKANATTSTSTTTYTDTELREARKSDDTSSKPSSSSKPAPTSRSKPYSEEFETVWEMFGKYGVKKKAWEYWRKLNEAQRGEIKQAIPDYLRVVEAGRTKKQFEGWINPKNCLWQNDWKAALSEWTKDSNGSKSAPTTPRVDRNTTVPV
jgi:uncharacterized protein YdaU (DUF1376 family)